MTTPALWADQPRDVTNVGTEVSEEECEERQEGEGEGEGGVPPSEGEEGRDVHQPPGQPHQAPPALPREAAGRDGPLLSTAGK